MMYCDGTSVEGIISDVIKTGKEFYLKTVNIDFSLV